jgi:hypothetical protein
MLPCHRECQQKNGGACVPKCCKPATVFATLGVATLVRHPLLGGGGGCEPSPVLELLWHSVRSVYWDARTAAGGGAASTSTPGTGTDRHITHDRLRTRNTEA